VNGGAMSAKFAAIVSASSRPATIPGVCGLGAMDLSVIRSVTLSQHLFFINW
jgi:hypothetical protein